MGSQDNGDYRDEREFRRELAVRGIKGLLGEGVEITCEKMSGKW
jgi:hypothetical protein